MNFCYLESYTEENGRKLIERAPGLKNIVIAGDFAVSNERFVNWKQLPIGMIVPLTSSVYQKFPVFSQAQMDRFALKATKMGTRITAIATCNRINVGKPPHLDHE